MMAASVMGIVPANKETGAQSVVCTWTRWIQNDFI